MRLSILVALALLGLAGVSACGNDVDRRDAGPSASAHPVGPARTPAVRGHTPVAAEQLGTRALDPYSLPADFHAASGPLIPSTTTLPVDETYGGSAGFAFRITQEGSGNGGWFRVRSPTSANRMALLATHTGEGIAARAINTGTGRAFWAQIPEPSNPFAALVATHVGAGEAIRGLNFGTGPAAVFEAQTSSFFIPAVEISNEGSGTGLRVESQGTPLFVRGISLPSSSSLLTLGTQDGGLSRGVFNVNRDGPTSLNNFSDAGDALTVENLGSSGNLAVFMGGVGDARIDNTGKGFFDGGTQTGGADIAESFDVEGPALRYAPGDVLVISTRSDRKVERSGEPYSMRVIGVLATKPGVLLSDEDTNAPGWGRVPVGVTGVVPTRVSAENGPIGRGDLLVTANLPGHAMRADEALARQGRIPNGAILGKALEPFSGPGAGTILVMVNVK